MNRNMLPHHMRIAALQCNFEGGSAQTMLVPKRWNEFGFNVEQLFHTHAELYNAVFDKEKYGGLLQQYLLEAGKHGIRVILYMNCHILLSSQKDKKSEWAQVDRKGNCSIFYDTYYGCCLNSAWVDSFMASIESLKDLDIQGIFFDGPSASPCFCKRCNEKFMKRYNLPIMKSSPDQLAEFTLKTQMEFIKTLYGKVKEVNPTWISYINASLMHSRASSSEMREILSYNDVVGTEGGFQFYGPPKNADIWHCGIHARLVEAVAGEKPKVIFMAGDHKPWSWYLHTPAETKLCYASILANGAGAWYGIHCSTAHLNGASGDAAKEMVKFDKKHEDLYNRTKSLADVALFFSFDTAKRYTSSGEETDFYQSDGFSTESVIGNYSESFQGAFAALFRSGIPCDIITELNIENLPNYAILVVPTGACMGQTTADAIRSFVKEGGVVIADSETSLYDEAGTKRKDFLLSDLFGVSFNQYRRYKTYDYFALEKGFDIFEKEGIPCIPAPTVALDISVSERCEILAKLCPPLPGRYAGRPETARYPFITKHRSGKGHTYYFAGTFFEHYRKYGIIHYKKLIQHILKQHSSPVVELINAPESMEFTVRESRPSDTIMVHLVNYSGGMTRPIDTVIPARGMSLRINRPFSSVKTHVSGQELEESKDGLIHIPEVKEFEVISIK